MSNLPGPQSGPPTAAPSLLLDVHNPTGQPSAAQKAAIEQAWAGASTIQRPLAEIILIVSQHPELLEWARASVSGTIRP